MQNCLMINSNNYLSCRTVCFIDEKRKTTNKGLKTEKNINKSCLTTSAINLSSTPHVIANFCNGVRACVRECKLFCCLVGEPEIGNIII